MSHRRTDSNTARALAAASQSLAAAALAAAALAAAAVGVSLAAAAFAFTSSQHASSSHNRRLRDRKRAVHVQRFRALRHRRPGLGGMLPHLQPLERLVPRATSRWSTWNDRLQPLLLWWDRPRTRRSKDLPVPHRPRRHAVAAVAAATRTDAAGPTIVLAATAVAYPASCLACPLPPCCFAASPR